MDIDFEALLQSFLAESEEGLALMEEAVMVLERQPRDQEALATVFRVAHTLKGTAAMFDFTGVERLAHMLEELLDRLRQQSLAVTGDLASLLLRSVDVLREIIPAAADGREQMSATTRSVLEDLRLAAAGELSVAASSGAASSRTPSSGAAESGKTLDGPPEGPGDEASRSLDGSGSTRAARSLRVDLDKLDQLLDLTGEIGIARGRLAQMLGNPDVSRAAVLENLSESDTLHRNLQELVMKLRMVPVGPTLKRYRRTVRDLARSHGKRVRLTITGEEVEVDTKVVEHLRDPLTHMVRNALDHGIESPEVRSAAGKDPCGLLTLEARHEAGSVVIELADDGAGLDREKILQRARMVGIVPDGEGLTAYEIDQLIFESGFTTAAEVTELSGRGVGMDVVRRNIEALRGAVAIDSREGEGTRLTIRLPLTLAIIDGLTVDVASETFFIPLESVVESVELPAGEGCRDDGRGVLNLRGRTLPYVRLRHLFRFEGPPAVRENVIVVEQARGQIAGLVVDALEGQSQAVIKPLAKLFRGLPGISGSTILGNGRVALILDLPSLLQVATEHEQINGDFSSRRASVLPAPSQLGHPVPEPAKTERERDEVER